MIGQRLLHFEIVEKLGEGGMGIVYTAYDARLDRLVAIKVLPPEKVADAERKVRLMNEARAASALDPPNILHIYDIGQFDGMDYIAMEYCRWQNTGEVDRPRDAATADAGGARSSVRNFNANLPPHAG
jgi:serine/threonine protein kinase